MVKEIVECIENCKIPGDLPGTVQDGYNLLDLVQTKLGAKPAHTVVLAAEEDQSQIIRTVYDPKVDVKP